MTNEELEMQEAKFDEAMQPLMDEISEFMEKQKKKQNIMMNPRGVARLNAVYSALSDIMPEIDPDYKIEIEEDAIIKGNFAINVYCDEFCITRENKRVINLILEHCPTVDIYYTTKFGGKTVLVFEIPKVYVLF